MVQLQLETFVDTGLHQAYFPKGRETWDEERVFREGQIFRRMDSPTMHWVVAFLETSLSDGTTREEIIGYSLWESPASPGIERTEEEKASARVQDLTYRPDSMDKEAHDKISAEMSVVFKHLLGEDPDNYWCKLPLTHSSSFCHLTIMSYQSYRILLFTQNTSGKGRQPRWLNGDLTKLRKMPRASCSSPAHSRDHFTPLWDLKRKWRCSFAMKRMLA